VNDLQVRRNEVRRGLADCRRHIRAAEQALSAAKGTAVYEALENLTLASAHTRSVLLHGGRYVPQERTGP
jgi:hypothetical protein